jgi:hypothetical protein
VAGTVVVVEEEEGEAREEGVEVLVVLVVVVLVLVVVVVAVVVVVVRLAACMSVSGADPFFDSVLLVDWFLFSLKSFFHCISRPIIERCKAVEPILFLKARSAPCVIKYRATSMLPLYTANVNAEPSTVWISAFFSSTSHSHTGKAFAFVANMRAVKKVALEFL